MLKINTLFDQNKEDRAETVNVQLFSPLSHVSLIHYCLLMHGDVYRLCPQLLGTLLCFGIITTQGTPKPMSDCLGQVEIQF